MATLGELLTEDQLTHLEGLVQQRKITTGWVQDIFIPRLSEELEHLDWIEQGWDIDLDDPKYASHRETYASEREKALAQVAKRRSTAFDRVLNQNVFQRSQRQIESGFRAIRTGEAQDRLAEYIAQQGPIGIAKDVGKSLIESIPRGIQATGKTFAEGGLGEDPISRLGEMTGAIPVVGGVSGGLARFLARSAVKRGVPTGARGSLARTLSGVAEGTRVPGYIGEIADVAGGEEDILIEGLLEVLGEGAVEAGRFAGRQGVKALTPEEKQAERKAANDAAAAERTQRINAGKIQAALELETTRLTELAQQIAGGDIAAIDDATFVETLEGLAPHLQPVIDQLEQLGLENAGEQLLGTILAKHQQAREAASDRESSEDTGRHPTGTPPETTPPDDTTDQQTTVPQTPEQAAAADLAGQPTAVIPPELQPETSHRNLPNRDADGKLTRAFFDRLEAYDTALRGALDKSIRQDSLDDILNTQDIDEDSRRVVEALEARRNFLIENNIQDDLPFTAQSYYKDTDKIDSIIKGFSNYLRTTPQETQPDESRTEVEAGETPGTESRAEGDTTDTETDSGTGADTRPDPTDTSVDGTQTPQTQVEPTPEEPEVDWAGLEADVGSEVIETLEREGYTSMEGAEPIVDNAIAPLISDGILTAADGERLKATVIEQITPALDDIRQRQETAEEVPETRVGTETAGFESDGTTEHRVRPVLRELDELVPSHQLDGQQRADYPEDLQPREARGGMISMEQVRRTASQPNFAWLLEFFKQFRDGPPLTSKKNPRRIVSGNGRTLALQLMRENYPENWEGYQEALRAELEKVGIDPAEADAMENPVLTYELLDDTDEVSLATDANTQATLDNTAAEQAGQDAGYFDDELMALWQPGSGDFAESLKSEANQSFRTALFNRIPTQLVSGFMTADNANFSNDGIQRIQNAMIRYVFGGDIGDQLAKIFIEEGIEDSKNIEAMLRNSIATLAYAKANGKDIGPDLASAIFRFIEFNQRADKDTRRIPKEVLLYAEVEAFYQTVSMVPVPLLEKQLLYLVYAKRNAPRQLAENFQTWARAVAVADETDLFGGGEAAADSESIFAGIIRNYISETIFSSPETSRMPPELTDLHQDIQAIPTADGKTQAVSDWTDAFLRNMNDGQEVSSATPETTADGEGEPRPDTARQRTGTDAATSGEPTPSDTGTGPGDERTGTEPDESERTEGDVDSVEPGEEQAVTREDLSEILPGHYLPNEMIAGINRALEEKGSETSVFDIEMARWTQDDGTRGKLTTAQARRVLWYLATGEKRQKLTNDIIEKFTSKFTSIQDLQATPEGDVDSVEPESRTVRIVSREDLPNDTEIIATLLEQIDNVEPLHAATTDTYIIPDSDESFGLAEGMSFGGFISFAFRPEGLEIDYGQPPKPLLESGKTIPIPDELQWGENSVDKIRAILEAQQGTSTSATQENNTETPTPEPEEPEVKIYRDESRYEQSATRQGIEDTKRDVRRKMEEGQTLDEALDTSIIMGRDVRLTKATVRYELEQEQKTGWQPDNVWARDPATWTAADILGILQNNNPVRTTGGTKGWGFFTISSAFRASVKQIEGGMLQMRISLYDRDLGIDFQQIEQNIPGTQANIKALRSWLKTLTETDIQEVYNESETTTPDDTPADSNDQTTPSQPEVEEIIDTNQVVGRSQARGQRTAPRVSHAIQTALDTLGISVDDWENAKANDQAEALINRQPQETEAQIDAAAELALDIAGDMTIEFDEEEDFDFDDDDLFNDVVPGRLRDITDEQRSDFDTVRRKMFLAPTIARLEGKQNRTPVETAQLRALTATQRTDAEQEVYERLLNAFIDRQVQRLQAKPQRSPTETRIFEALTAVQAEGLPEEASNMSLYADLETPDQAHPRTLAETRTLAGVDAPPTADTEINLPRAVTGDTTKLSPAQLSSVKAIVAAFKRKIHTDLNRTVQGGFLLGDKMGVGKTRQALATIWHYMRNGVEKHFVLAPNETLLNNYTVDMKELGGPASDLSNYNSGNRKLTTPVGTATYSMIIRKPNLSRFMTNEGNQNAIADIVEHLTGSRPTLMQTHPRQQRAAQEAFGRIGINLRDGATRKERIDNAAKALREQARRLNLENPEHVENFRQRVTPALAELLMAERRGDPQQRRLFEGSDIEAAVEKLLDFAEANIYANPDPNFEEAAEAFEGVIILDEMHKAAGLSSQTGRAIDALHQLLPNAKFLYMSATPFKEIENFFVASRLGLWGANQPFPTVMHFIRAFRRKARAIKEVIPLHLKQVGRYISRALSSKETRYTPTEIPLTETEREQYDTAVTFVQTIRNRYEASIDRAKTTSWGRILDVNDKFHLYKAKYMRMFYGQTQKFFLAVLDSMKAQGLEGNIRQQLENGDKIIVQLENTWKQTVERARARGQTDIGPFDLLIDFVESENMFPIHAHTIEVRTNRRGEPYEVVVPLKEYQDGKQVRVVDPSLKQMQTEFLDMLKSSMEQNPLAGNLPFAADIIHQIAQEVGVASGEISGRSEIYPQGTPVKMPQDTNSKDARAREFSETTDLNLIVLGPAGLTGINLPITEKIKDKVGSLYHYLVQSSWNVNTFEQGLGRGKRSNSAIDPHYMVAYQDLPGADRVLGATLAKFAEMGALAGQADNALMQNIDKVEGETSIEDDAEADVFEDEQGERSHVFGTHGQEALAQLWYDIYNSDDPNRFDLPDTLGLTRPELAGDTGFIDPKTIPDVKEFYQRLLHQKTDDQFKYYQEFESRLKRIVTYKKELGQLDTGANNLNSQNGEIVDRLTVYTDPDTRQTTEVVKLSVERQLPRRSWDFLQKVVQQAPGYEHHGGNRYVGVYQDVDGHVWAVFEHPFTEGGETDYVRWGPRGTPVPGVHKGEHRISAEELATDFTPIELADRTLDIGEAKELWETEDTEADAYVDSELYMATGLLLSKWDALKVSDRQPEVMGIIPMRDGSQLHGRVIPANAVSQVLQQIGGVDPNYFNPEQRRTQDELPADPGIDIPSLVREIIGKQTDTQIQARLNNIVEHIHKKLPLQLKGHLVRSPAEAALLGQLIRDPQIEHVWTVYRREGRIVKIEPRTLNKKGEADVGDIEDVKRTVTEEGADSILFIHNHPSGVAKWSEGDKAVAMSWHRALGTLLAEDIIVDSGTYGYMSFENGEYTWHGDIPLENTDWDTNRTPMKSPEGELRSGDPLYENPLIRGARAAATYMYQIKHRSADIAELIFVDMKSGKIATTITDPQIRGSENPREHLQNLIAQRPGDHVHVMTWGDTALAQALDGIEGVDSVWVNDTRWTGVEHTMAPDPQQTITRDVGGVEQEFVKASNTLLDPNNPASKKRVVIANISQLMVKDDAREDLTTPDRQFPSDAEHMTTQDNFQQILQSGLLKPSTREYTVDFIATETSEVFLSHGRYYRNNPEHTYGLILDFEKLQKAYPSAAFRVHSRATESGRTAQPSETHTVRPGYLEAGTSPQYGPEGPVEFILQEVGDIPISDFLVGIIDNSEVYIKPEYARATPEGKRSQETQADLAGQPRSRDNTFQDYQQSAEVPAANRAVRAMPQLDRLNLKGGRTERKWVSPQSKLFEKMRLWSPKLRKAKRILDNALRSGYGLLEELNAPWDSDKPGPGQVIRYLLDHRQEVSQLWTGRTRTILTPVLNKLHSQIKRDDSENVGSRRAAVDKAVINFIENNTPLPDELKKYESIATELKEAWRKVNQSFVEAWIKHMRDMGHREEIVKWGTRGVERWSPEPMGDFVWSWDVKDPDGKEGAFVTRATFEALKDMKKGRTPGQSEMELGQTIQTFSIAQAFAKTDQLYYPHQYDRSRLRHHNRKIEDLIRDLNAVVAKGENATDEDLAKIGVQKVDGGYLVSKLNTVFPDLDTVLHYYVNVRDRTSTLIKWYDDGTVGMYPHLERIRETHDQLYKRDTGLLMSTAALLWDRYAEILTFGQIDPFGDLPPRLASVLDTVEHFEKNERESALMEVVRGLHATKESRIDAPDGEDWGMHESIEAFAEGERAAYDIMQMWEDYYIDDDGNKVKTGKWKGIDINRLGLDQQTLGVLEKIGFIQPDGGGGHKVYGKSDAAQQKTIAKFFVELMQTRADRKRKIQKLVQSLGHWEQKDALSKDGDELWKWANSGVTFGALGWKQALQNLTEIPAVAMLAGTKSTMGMVKNMQDPEFRQAASILTDGLKHGIEFLADDNMQEKYLDSAWSMFGRTERASRMIGVGVGLTHAKSLSEQLLASAEGSKERGRIEREMRSLNMNPEVILEMPADQLEAVWTETLQRIKSLELPLAGVELPSTAPAKNRYTDRVGATWASGAVFLSDTIFKQYDARTLPSMFNNASPALRVILKFKGWMLQQNRFIADQYKRSYVEARRHGNFRPLQNMLASTVVLTGSVGMAQTMFSLLQDRDEDDKLLRSFLHTQTLGLSAVLWELALRSEGSPWRLEKSIEGMIVGPVWGVFADMLAPTMTGDLDRTLQEVMQRTPITREAMYLGANRWWEDE